MKDEKDHKYTTNAYMSGSGSRSLWSGSRSALRSLGTLHTVNIFLNCTAQSIFIFGSALYCIGKIPLGGELLDELLQFRTVTNSGFFILLLLLHKQGRMLLHILCINKYTRENTNLVENRSKGGSHSIHSLLTLLTTIEAKSKSTY